MKRDGGTCILRKIFLAELLQQCKNVLEQLALLKVIRDLKSFLSGELANLQNSWWETLFVYTFECDYPDRQ